jgi:uncharacterized protein YbjT (DUF2867 family)
MLVPQTAPPRWLFRLQFRCRALTATLTRLKPMHDDGDARSRDDAETDHTAVPSASSDGVTSAIASPTADPRSDTARAPANPAADPRSDTAGDTAGSDRARTVLVTGATGYVGGRLVPRLLAAGASVRVLVRNADRIRGREWAERVQVVTGDVHDDDALRVALEGVDAAYFLIHSMHAGADFAERDRAAAGGFAAAAAAAGVSHVVYLGGLLPATSDVSTHLASRAEVGDILRATVPTTEFRAGPIIGSGSASFEMIRYLTERLPMMIAPRWIRNDVQPIAVRDVLSYLVAALDTGPLGVIDIGADRLSFLETMKVYAEVRGLRRVITPVPVLAPRLAALWVGLVTPIPNRLAVPLIRGIIHPVVADLERARRHFPQIEPLPYRAALRLAFQRIEQGSVPTRWSGALGRTVPAYDVSEAEGVIREVRSVHVAASPDQVFAVLSRLGGDRGWLVWNWAWKLRGAMDRVAGGPGLRRGRRHPEQLLPGEALDFWRVEIVRPPDLLRLRAEMKVPGAAWLEWATYGEDGGTRLVQTATFAPRGLSGTLYWYTLYPVHRSIFSGLIRAIGRTAVAAPPADGQPGRGAERHQSGG